MPELPEVEVARQAFAKVLVGKVIKDIKGDVPKMVSPKLSEFAKELKGKKISGVGRRAKLFLIEVGDSCVALHFKLTGQLVYQGKGPLLMGGHPMDTVHEVPNKFTHLTFYFTDGSILYFNDLRKFAYAKLFKTCDINQFNDEKYGVEPLSSAFTLNKFNEILDSRPKSKIKQFLLDQSYVAGIGNIYADEILFYAHVRPLRPNKTLTETERRELFIGIRDILKESVAKGSTSYDSYAGQDGLTANFNSFLKVYQREGEKCVRDDGGIIKRIKINGRSSHFCPVCQK